MTFVLLILVILATGYLAFRIDQASQQKRELTFKRMEALQTAILNYRRKNHRLPCPAVGSYTIASQYMGVEAANPGSCTGGTPAAGFTAANIAGGTVPTRTLGLSDDFMLDGWGRRFTYAVDMRATSACSFVTYEMDDATVGFTINNASGSAITSNAWYTIISHGQNGHGGYLPSGVRYSANSSNTDEQTNCHCDASAAATAFGGVFVDKPATLSSASALNRYDDITRYALRGQIRSTQDETGATEVCP